MSQPIVSCQWLKENLFRPELVILDASMKPVTERGSFSAIPSYLPGARKFNIKKEFSNLESPYPNTMLSPEAFEAGCQRLGIGQDSLIVVYDNQGIYSSPRAWWMFQAMGHEQVFVLDGGLPEWEGLGLPTVEALDTEFESGDFKAGFRPEKMVAFDFVASNLATQNWLVIDARAAERFQSLVDEPRAGVRRGNIPQSINLPFAEVLENGKFKSQEALADIFEGLARETRPLVFSCASGVTACIVLMASELVFSGEKAIFDGSWTEWALRVD